MSISRRLATSAWRSSSVPWTRTLRQSANWTRRWRDELLHVRVWLGAHVVTASARSRRTRPEAVTVLASTRPGTHGTIWPCSRRSASPGRFCGKCGNSSRRGRRRQGLGLGEMPSLHQRVGSTPRRPEGERGRRRRCRDENRCRDCGNVIKAAGPLRATGAGKMARSGRACAAPLSGVRGGEGSAGVNRARRSSTRVERRGRSRAANEGVDGRGARSCRHRDAFQGAS